MEKRAVPTGSPSLPTGVQVQARLLPGFKGILTPQALRFVTELTRRFRSRVDELVRMHSDRQSAVDELQWPDFQMLSEGIRRGDWKVAPVPDDLRDRRVEIAGPVDRRAIVRALNSGARVFIADFEDATSPTWKNCIQGQINLRDATRRSISHESDGRQFKLNKKTATLMVRPRSLRRVERHVLVDGRPVPAALFDFGLFFFHNAHALLERGSGPYFDLPKLQGQLEARIWNDIFLCGQDALGIDRGTIKAAVPIETTFGAFEMDEILFELKDHSAGLHGGSSNYIFSFIRTFRNHSQFLVPGPGSLATEAGFVRACDQLLVKTCHRRGAQAVGDIARQIPIKGEAEANEARLDRVRADKLREVKNGHDGTRVAHPAMVPVAMEIFDLNMPSPNQLHRLRESVEVGGGDLLKVPGGPITGGELRFHVGTGLRYLEAWMRGSGWVALYGRVGDMATAETARAQLWQWVRHGGTLQGGRRITATLVRNALEAELEGIRRELGERYASSRFDEAAELLDGLIRAEEFTDSLALAACDRID